MRLGRRALYRTCLLAIAVSCPCPALAQTPGAPSTPDRVNELRLRPGDVLRLAVKDEPLLAGEYPVLSDGAALLPLIGLVQVAGEPFGGVMTRVRAAYARELTDAVVVLVPLLRVSVTGEVRLPGVVMVDPTYTWSEVLAQAGGVLPTAARARAVLVRNGTEHELKRAGHILPPDVDIVSGDQLVLPRRGWVAENLPILIGSAASVLAAAVTTLLIR